MSDKHHPHPASPTRRQLLSALAGAGLSASLPWLPAQAATDNSRRILVVMELSGANDGLNTLVPYADDAYYRLRPKIGIRPEKVRKIDQQYGFSPGMSGFEKLYKDGPAVVLAFHLHGVLAYRCAEWWRALWLAGPCR